MWLGMAQAMARGSVALLRRVEAEEDVEVLLVLLVG
jgi:hypothetical protein